MNTFLQAGCSDFVAMLMVPPAHERMACPESSKI